MQVTKLKEKGLEKEFKITISSKDVSEKLNSSLLQISKDVEIKGFRKGKAPVNIVKKKYESRVVAEVIEKIVQDNTKKLLEEKKIKPFRLPRVEITKYKNYSSKITELTKKWKILLMMYLKN